MDLEVHHGLNLLIPAHIWLLHHLFLDAANQDTQEWAAAWNSHVLQIRGKRARSPRDMYLFSMLQDGPRGLEYRAEPVDEVVEDPSTYGIDWTVADDVAEGYSQPVGSLDWSMIWVVVERTMGNKYKIWSQAIECENAIKTE
jgi:hypothetical protein